MQIYYYLFALGLSLQSVPVLTGFSIYLSDISALLFALFALLNYKKVNFDFLILAASFLVGYILIANLSNYYLIKEFSFLGFFTNFLKLLAIFFILLFSPSLVRVLDTYKLIKAILVILCFHCLIVILDQYIVYPWGFNNDGLTFNAPNELANLAGRARGLFEEPSFFAFYAGVTTSVILQYEKIKKVKVVNFFHVLIIFSGLIAAGSLTALAALFIVFVQLLIVKKEEYINFRKFLESSAVLLISFPLIITLLLGSVTYLSGRITDTGSPIVRLYGGTMFTVAVVEDRPLIGVGLGGKNQDNFYETLEDTINFDLFDMDAETSFSTVTFWSALVAAGGLPAFFIYYLFINGYMIFKPALRYLGITVLILGATKGGVFDIFLWWLIAFSISVPSRKKSEAYE